METNPTMSDQGEQYIQKWTAAMRNLALDTALSYWVAEHTGTRSLDTDTIGKLTPEQARDIATKAQAYHRTSPAMMAEARSNRPVGEIWD
jgi:hypothetical protein